jgi:osmotically-inducible protein OsmY
LTDRRSCFVLKIDRLWRQTQRPINIFVHGGVVGLWGLVNNIEEDNVIRIAAEATPGARTVNDNLRIYPSLALVY